MLGWSVDIKFLNLFSEMCLLDNAQNVCDHINALCIYIIY